MVNDTIADVLTRIRNAGNARHRVTKVPSCYIAGELLRLLKQEGYIDAFSKDLIPDSKFEEYTVHLKFDSNGAPIIKELRRYSKPGRRVHVQTKDLPKVR